MVKLFVLLYNVKYYVLHYQKPQRVIITLLRCVK